jgi:hypothetical protein
MTTRSRTQVVGHDVTEGPAENRGEVLKQPPAPGGLFRIRQESKPLRMRFCRKGRDIRSGAQRTSCWDQAGILNLFSLGSTEHEAQYQRV